VQPSDSAAGSSAEALRRTLKKGVQNARDEDWAAARRRLARVHDAAPDACTDAHGSVAYWYGRALEAQGRTKQARSVWKKSSDGEAVPFDVRAADAYLDALLGQGLGSRRSTAVRVYERILKAMDAPVRNWEVGTLRHHVAQVAPMMDEADLARVVENPDDDPDEWRLSAEAGTEMKTWWRRLDPAASTAENERIEEHLMRLTVAHRKYADPTRVSGLDDRGEVYLRLGKPSNRHTIRYNDMDFMQEVYALGVNVRPGDFPKNEIWSYPGYDGAARYIFYDSPAERGGYRLGGASDLLPPALRSNFNASKRSRNRAYSSIRALHYIYEHLSMHYSGFGNVYDRLDQYLSQQRSAEALAEARRRRGRGSNAGGIGFDGDSDAGDRTLYARPGGLPGPSNFVRDLIHQTKQQKRGLRRRQEERVDRQRTRLYDGVETLPAAVRTARFLDEDGTTRTEVYWGLPPRALGLSKQTKQRLRKNADLSGVNAHLLSVSVTQHETDYRRRKTREGRYLVRSSGAPRPQTIEVRRDTGTYHLSVEMQHFLAEAGADPSQTRIRRQVQAARTRIDSLKALPTDRERLVMSDLKPMISTSDASQAPLAEAHPFVGSRLPSETPLVLYFEVYHLAFGADDQTRYTVEYEVNGRSSQEGIARLLGGDTETRQTATETTHQGTSRKAKRYIMIDLADWTRVEENDLRVTVRVTDEVTGQTVERSMQVQLAE
jgi:GWxTD domain-containing protein